MATLAQERPLIAEPAALAGRAPDRRLKICFISETVHAGVGRHLTDVLCALADRGHELHLLYSPLRLEPAFLAEIRRKSSILSTEIRMPRAIGRGDGAAFLQIRDYVLRHGPFDVIHGHSSKGGGYARLLRLLQPAPIVYTPHAFITLSPMTHPGKKLAYGTIEAMLARLTARIICTSAHEQDHARALSIPVSRLSTILHGVAQIAGPSRDQVRADLGLTKSEVVVGFVGRMDDQKAPERLVAAARQLLPDFPELTFLMIGDGPKRGPLEAEIQAAGLGGRMRWLGAVNARHYMPAMDMLAVTSLYEGFAYVLIEALHAGLPIVTTPVGGAHEAVDHEVNGLIVPHGNLDAYAAAIRGLARDEQLRWRMGDASRAHAAQFTIPAMVNSLENLYRTVSRRPSSVETVN